MQVPEMVTAVREKLRRCRGHWPAVQRKARVSRSWLTQFTNGKITDPRVGTLQAVGAACDEVIAAVARLNEH